MATFAARVALATDDTLAPRIQIAVVLAALVVAEEPRPEPTASQDERTASNVRRSFARKVLDDPTGIVPRLRWILACTCLADIEIPTDDEILACVTQAWDALSGA